MAQKPQRRCNLRFLRAKVARSTETQPVITRCLIARSSASTLRLGTTLNRYPFLISSDALRMFTLIRQLARRTISIRRRSLFKRACSTGEENFVSMHPSFPGARRNPIPRKLRKMARKALGKCSVVDRVFHYTASTPSRLSRSVYNCELIE